MMTALIRGAPVRTGGGYQYRLCRANESLTEECFMRRPLEFVRTSQQLAWNNSMR